MYAISQSSQNCKPTTVVSTLDGCKEAARKHDFTFKSKVEKVDRHAGCYKDYNTGFVYLNKIVNPAETNPVLGKKGRRAICIEDGKLFIIDNTKLHLFILMFKN